MTLVRSGVTKPEETARAVSASSLASSTSTSPSPGESARIGRLAPSDADGTGKIST